jgi:hypothetical protein
MCQDATVIQNIEAVIGTVIIFGVGVIALRWGERFKKPPQR